MKAHVPMEPLTLHYSEGLLRRAVWAFWWRATGWSHVALLAFASAVFGARVWSGDRSWAVGVIGTGLAFFAALSATGYVSHYRESLGRFRRMRVPEATLELGRSTFGSPPTWGRRSSDGMRSPASGNSRSSG